MMSEEYLRLLRRHPKLKGFRRELEAFRERGDRPLPSEIRERMAELKRRAVDAGNEALAKAIWCLEAVAKVQDHFTAAYRLMRTQAFYDAWCELERADIKLQHLDRHYTEDRGRYGLEFARGQLAKFQELYPYEIFASPEYVYQQTECSVCGQRMTPLNPCGHKKGEIYAGSMCVRVVKGLEIVGIALVKNPVQKYSVLGPAGRDVNDNYDYSSIEYVARGLRSPWDGWDFEMTKTRHPHELYADVSPADPCPCESGKNYEDCCSNESGVLRPHLQIVFEKMPPPELPKIRYPERVGRQAE